MVIRAPDQRSAQGAYERLDDRMLVLDFQAGHPEAFVEIHNRYSPLARRVCLRFLRNQQDADEAFQETMIRVFNGLHRFNGRYALSPWVARIAKNVSLDMIRSRGRRPQEEEGGTDTPELADAVGDTPEAAYERLVERDLVLSVLADMPVPHRDALVLRELEGRSHRDIANELEITPSQAKALIHRAKASFRRRWLVAVTEKGHLSAIAVLPLLWAAKVIDLGKRVVERVGHGAQLAQAATPEVVAAASASPAAPAAAVGIGERVVAAGMTLLLAGGVTVGAAKIVQHKADKTNEAAAVVAPVLEELEEEFVPTETEAPAGTADDQVGDVTAPEMEPGPMPADLPYPTEVPATEEPPTGEDPAPGEDPNVPPDDPSPTVDPPTVPAAPAWSGSFAIAWTSEDKCGCGSGLELVSSNATGSLLGTDGQLVVSQSLRGAALDAEGDAAWALEADLSAELRRNGGSLDLSFSLTKGGVTTHFGGSAIVTSAIGDPDSGETISYLLSGTYEGAGAEHLSPIRMSGPLSAQLVVWGDGTSVFLTNVSLLP